MKLALSSKTINAIDGYVKSPYVSLIVNGGIGYGVNEVLDYIIDLLTKGKADPLHIKQIDKGEESITIDEIRQLKMSLKLKNVSSKDSKRLIVIRNAENITLEAQNSLLKLLEDSPKETLFLFGTQSIEKLINTVISRSQILDIIKPSIKEVCQYYDMPKEKISSIYLMCDGRPGFIDQSINNQDSEIKSTFEIAKVFIRSSSFDRLNMCERVLKEYNLRLFMFCLTQIFIALISSQNKTNNSRYNNSLIILAECQEDLERTRPNNKLLMTRISLNV
jgi:hypothetical protein